MLMVHLPHINKSFLMPIQQEKNIPSPPDEDKLVAHINLPVYKKSQS